MFNKRSHCIVFVTVVKEGSALIVFKIFFKIQIHFFFKKLLLKNGVHEMRDHMVLSWMSL